MYVLTHKQAKCAQLMAQGITQNAIAAELNVHPNTITNWKKSSEFMDTYNEMLKDSVRYLASDALQVQRNLLHARSEMVRYLVAKDILDRAGFKPSEQVVLDTDTDLNISIDYGG